MNAWVENPEEEDAAMMQQFDKTHDESFEFNVKHGKCLVKAKMTEKRAKHCLAMVEDPKNSFNKLILAIGGIQVGYRRDPYLKQTKQRVKDLASVEFFSLNDKKWERYNAKLQIARH
jgi:hypothetical protein